MLEWWSKIRRALGGRRGLAEDLAEEIAANLEIAREDQIARGMTAERAQFQARKQFGNPRVVQELAREAWMFPRFETFLQDLRYGFRGIAQAPAYSLIVVLTLALGIGANTAIFSVVQAVLLKPLPFPDPERLVFLEESFPKGDGISVSWGNFLYWRKLNHSFDDMAGREAAHFTLTGLEEPLFTRAGVVTNSFFQLTGVQPMFGRTFTQDDDHTGAPRTMILDHRFWTTRLGSDRGILGRALTLDGKDYTVIGVMAPGVQLAPMLGAVDFYLPLGLFRNESQPRAQHGSIRLIARLKPGVTLASAKADLDSIMQHLAESDPGAESTHKSYIRSLSDVATASLRPTLIMLMAAVGLILLIACANVASLVLAKSATRTREIAIRTAIGAGRARLVRQVLTENILIALIGGACGLLLASWSIRTLLATAPDGVPRLSETTLDLRVLLFTAGLTILTGVFLGLTPILTAGKLELVSALNSGGRSGTSTKRERSLRDVLVVCEIMITVVLAFSSSLLIRSLIKAQSTDPGFNPQRLVALELVLPSSAYNNPQSIQNFYDELQRHLRDLPGVKSVGSVNCPPSGGDCNDWFYSVLGERTPAKNEVPISVFNIADTEYFHTMSIPLREGRAFDSRDREGAPLVAVVNEVLARKWWPHSSAVGHVIKFGGPYQEGKTYEIVGVAGTVSQEGLDSPPMPEVYWPAAQSPTAAMVVMIRCNGDPNSLIPSVRRVVNSADRNLAIQRVRPFEQIVASTLNRRRFSASLLAIFAALALILSAVGVYGLLNYWVTAREEEIAIRMALGARRSTILRWAGLAASKLVAIGIAVGLMAGWGASHWLKSLVFGISPQDSGMMIASVLTVVAIAALAAAVPLTRATRIDAARKLQRA